MAVGVSYHKQLMKALAFVGLVLLASTSLVEAASSVDVTTSTEDMFMHEEHLKLPSQRSYKTIQSPQGDLIDCVPTHLQPAFDHPKLRGEKPLSTVAPESPKGRPPGTPEQKPQEFQSRPWLPAGDSCPDGTIPIKRTTDDPVRRLKREMVFGRGRNGLLANAVPGVEFATGIATGKQYCGAEAVIDLSAPKLENEEEFSLAGIWISSYAGGNHNAIQVGWQLYPANYGDYNPRLSIYWTADGYKSTGCYDLDCPGFVQTNKDVVIGGALSPVSTYNGTQYSRTFAVWKDPISHNWWLEYELQSVGYWPASLFTNMANCGTAVAFGGAIHTNQSGQHTTTEMGSGHFSREGPGRAASFQNLRVVNTSHYYVPVPTLTPSVTNAGCYDYSETGGGSWAHYFYYGGPGRNANCP